MPHRKPLGTTCRLHFKSDEWPERAPELGDYFESASGLVYLIVGIEEGRTRTHYVCERVAGHSADGCWVYGFYWLPRDRRRQA